MVSLRGEEEQPNDKGNSRHRGSTLVRTYILSMDLFFCHEMMALMLLCLVCSLATVVNEVVSKQKKLQDLFKNPTN